MSGNSSSFTIDNIPFGVISYGEKAHRCATALGDEAIDLHELSQSGFFKDGKVNEALLNVSAFLFSQTVVKKSFFLFRHAPNKRAVEVIFLASMSASSNIHKMENIHRKLSQATALSKTQNSGTNLFKREC